MSDTPDLDKAQLSIAKFDGDCNLRLTLGQMRAVANWGLEQRAEEVERCTEFVAFTDGIRLDKRAAELRRQAGGAK